MWTWGGTSISKQNRSKDKCVRVQRSLDSNAGTEASTFLRHSFSYTVWLHFLLHLMVERQGWCLEIRAWFWKWANVPGICSWKFLEYLKGIPEFGEYDSGVGLAILFSGHISMEHSIGEEVRGGICCLFGYKQLYADLSSLWLKKKTFGCICLCRG